MPMCGKIVVLAATAFLFAGIGCAQDSPSLGDVARQQRTQKESAASKDAQAPRVITNEEIPEHPSPEPATAAPRGEHGAMHRPR